MKLHINGNLAIDVAADVTAGQVIDAAARAGARYESAVIVYRNERYLTPDEPMAALGYTDGATVDIISEPPPCIHGSPCVPGKGYLCGWC
jgi:hypothetical protein